MYIYVYFNVTKSTTKFSNKDWKTIVELYLSSLVWSIMACRIYIGNLPLDIRESELDDLFYK